MDVMRGIPFGHSAPGQTLIPLRYSPTAAKHSNRGRKKLCTPSRFAPNHKPAALNYAPLGSSFVGLTTTGSVVVAVKLSVPVHPEFDRSSASIVMASVLVRPSPADERT